MAWQLPIWRSLIGPSHAPVATNFAWRSVLAMFTIAPLIGLLVLALPRSDDFDSHRVIPIIGTGFVAGIWLLYRRERLGRAELVGLLSYASLAVTAADLLSGSLASPFSSFQIWPMVCSALFLPRVGLSLVLALAVSGTACAILTSDQTGDGLVRWSVLTTSLVVVTVIVRRIAHQVGDQLRRLQTQSRTDGLTGLLNRRAFDEVLDRECRLAARAGPGFALALLDVDSFKAINDARGHAGGDAVLCAVASALRSRLRATDDLFRIGGDEFAVVLRGCDIEHASKALRDALELMTVLTDGVTLSVGVASCPGHSAVADALLGLADAALYSAKSSGRATLQVAALKPELSGA